MPWWMWLSMLGVLWAIPIIAVAVGVARVLIQERRERRLMAEGVGPVESEGETPMGWPDRYAGTRPRPHAGGTFREDVGA